MHKCPHFPTNGGRLVDSRSKNRRVVLDAAAIARLREQLRAEYGSGEGLPDVTPEGIALWNRTHSPDNQLDDDGRLIADKREKNQ